MKRNLRTLDPAIVASVIGFISSNRKNSTPPPPPKKDNTALFVGVGFGVLILMVVFITLTQKT